MFPMIATVEEFDEAKALVERELTHLRRHGHKLPERVEIGAMVEVPSLLFQLDELLERVDFLSVGSNDLVQFLFAADRGNARVADRFDPISAPVLRALKADRRQGPRAMASRSRCAANSPPSRSARWRWSRSAIARCRCRRPRSARSRPCCSISMPARPQPLIEPADRQSGRQRRRSASGSRRSPRRKRLQL